MTLTQARKNLKAASKELAEATEVQAQAMARWIAAYQVVQELKR